MTWRAQLENPSSQHHFVQTYKTEAELLGPLIRYASAGLRRREALILVMTKPHGDSLSLALSGLGFRLGDLRQTGQMLLLDAGQTLASFMENGDLVPGKFFDFFEPVLVEAKKRFPAVRAFGEMVNLLYIWGKLDIALALEKLWNDLLQRHQFSLLCAYAIDSFGNGGEASALKAVCQTHSHYIPTPDYERLEGAVFEAMDAVLGASQSAMLRTLVASQSSSRQSTQMPLAQAILIWLGENMPLLSEKILLRSKELYGRDSAAPGYYA